MKGMAGTPILANQYSIPPQGSVEQVEKILASSTFRSAQTLQTLLRFLTSKALDEAGEEMKEYTIGVEALGRRPDFDPKTDPIVRVQVYRLRQKLKEYYDAEGAGDSVLVRIPKGHYLPHFEPAAPMPPALRPVAVREHAPSQQSEGPVEIETKELRRTGAVLMLSLILALAGFAAGYWTHRLTHHLPVAQEVKSIAAEDPVQAFWSPFLKEDPSPIIAYADAMFLLDGSSDLFRFRHGASYDRGAPVDMHIARQFAANAALVSRAGPLYYDNGYTGTGELQSVALLTALFTRMGATPTVLSSFDLTASDLGQHNVILLGSPFQNVAVEQLPAAGDFTFFDPATEKDLWDGRIDNSRPQPGESSVYRTERDPKTQIVKADYALITLQGGVSPGRHIINLGGLDTTGTLGAVMVATSRTGIEQLNAKLASDKLDKTKIQTFQALIRVNLEKGYQVLDTQLVAVHRLGAEHATSGTPSSVSRK